MRLFLTLPFFFTLMPRDRRSCAIYARGLQIMANQAMDTSADDRDPMLWDPAAQTQVGPAPKARDLPGGPGEAEGRESGIMEVEGKASAVTGGVAGAEVGTVTSTTTKAISTPIGADRRE